MRDDNKILKERIKELESEVLSLKQQQIDVNRAKELYLKIFEEFPALIWRSRLDKLCDYFNKTWLDFTGRSMEQEFGNGWAEGVHPDDFSRCLDIYVTSFDKREAFLMEYRLKDKFGEYRWIRDFGRPFYDLDNTFLGYIGSCYDITEIKDSEIKLTELNATKDKFFSIIAHDLKNPFHNILLCAELLTKCVSTNDFTKLNIIVKDLYASSVNTYNLLENLLEWANTQTRRISFDPQNVNLAEIYNETIENLYSNAQEKNIELKYILNKKIVLCVDRNMIKTVIRNLVSNAIKYSHKNGKVEILTEKTDDNVIITISDKGIGIKKEKLESIFDITKIISTPGTGNEIGTGLGLLLCKEFIEKHNGKIWVESEYGLGSNFKFSLPLNFN